MSTKKIAPPNKWGDRLQQHQNQIALFKAIALDLLDQIADRPGATKALVLAIRLLLPLAAHRRGKVPWARRDELIQQGLERIDRQLAEAAGG
jgi:hypothetical protein